MVMAIECMVSAKEILKLGSELNIGYLAWSWAGNDYKTDEDDYRWLNMTRNWTVRDIKEDGEFKRRGLTE